MSRQTTAEPAVPQIGSRETTAHLYELIRQRAHADPWAVALGGQQGLMWKTLSSRQLLELVDRLASELTEQGIREGDRVVLWVPNQWRTPIFLFALWKLGAVVVKFDREMNPDAGARILRSVELAAPSLVTTSGQRGSAFRLVWTAGWRASCHCHISLS